MFPKSEPPPALRGFDVLERLGAGGAGQVFLARSRAGKLVAIKVLSDVRGGSRDEEFHQALAREASLCVRLNHPAIVQVRALVEEQGFAALVFEYVEGVALVRLLRFCARHGVRLPDRAAWHVVERVLAALAYAHSQRDENYQPAPIVHRDVSPANVLVDWTGGVKLADFGMAKMLGVSPATRVGVVKGTLGCMSPEQARGEAVTERADVYAAALLAWRLATGRTPFAKFKDDEVELLRAMRNPRLRPLAALRPDLPEAILSGIAAALEPDPEKRTISADELRTRIRSSLDVESGHAELGELLARWRAALVKTLARGDDSTSHSGSGSGDGHRITSEYGEAALAFDDEGVLDGPTFETYSLPSDAAILATLPIEGPLELAMPPPPSTAEPNSDSVRPPPPPATLESISFPIPPPARLPTTNLTPAAAPAAPVPEPPVPAPSSGLDRTALGADAPSRRSTRLAVVALAIVVVCAAVAYLAK